ncbi:hypothetical protein LXL04_025926 [Taraxacum kok-saghyz]
MLRNRLRDYHRKSDHQKSNEDGDHTPFQHFPLHDDAPEIHIPGLVLLPGSFIWIQKPTLLSLPKNRKKPAKSRRSHRRGQAARLCRWQSLPLENVIPPPTPAVNSAKWHAFKIDKTALLVPVVDYDGKVTSIVVERCSSLKLPMVDWAEIAPVLVTFEVVSVDVFCCPLLVWLSILSLVALDDYTPQLVLQIMFWFPASELPIGTPLFI